jgi:hypothetical protein
MELCDALLEKQDISAPQIVNQEGFHTTISLIQFNEVPFLALAAEACLGSDLRPLDLD